MRLKSRTVFLALVAVFALSAVTAASASAVTPEFKPVPTKKKFTSSSVTVTFESAGNTLTCEKSATAGEITGAKTIGKVVVKFTGCKISGSGGSNCAIKSKNTSTAGEILTDALDGELGTVSTTQASSGVGVLLKPESGTLWTELEANTCTHATKVNGSIAAEVATIGKKQATNKFVFATSGGSQGIKKITLDSGKSAEPELVAWSETLTMNKTDEVSFEEALEVT
jgi:hypothetical protein